MASTRDAVIEIIIGRCGSQERSQHFRRWETLLTKIVKQIIHDIQGLTLATEPGSNSRVEQSNLDRTIAALADSGPDGVCHGGVSLMHLPSVLSSVCNVVIDSMDMDLVRRQLDLRKEHAADVAVAIGIEPAGCGGDPGTARDGVGETLVAPARIHDYTITWHWMVVNWYPCSVPETPRFNDNARRC